MDLMPVTPKLLGEVNNMLRDSAGVREVIRRDKRELQRLSRTWRRWEERAAGESKSGWGQRL